MTDNEIIKALECCISTDNIVPKCEGCPYDGDDLLRPCNYNLMNDSIALISRQKAEIERFTKRQKPTGASGYKIENGKVVFFTNMLGGCRHEYENLDEVVKTLNELLHEAYSKDEIAFALHCKTEDLKTAKSEARKEFAERLKKVMVAINKDINGYCEYRTDDCEIDNLLAEMESEGK